MKRLLKLNKLNASHITQGTHHFCEDVGEFYTIFTFRLSFWTLFDTPLMNFIRKYVLLFIRDF